MDGSQSQPQPKPTPSQQWTAEAASKYPATSTAIPSNIKYFKCLNGTYQVVNFSSDGTTITGNKTISKPDDVYIIANTPLYHRFAVIATPDGTIVVPDANNKRFVL